MKSKSIERRLAHQTKKACAKCDKDAIHVFSYGGHGEEEATTLYYCDEHISDVYTFDPKKLKITDFFATAKKGESEGAVVRVEETVDGKAMLVFPMDITGELGWEEGDEIDIAISESYFDWGEVPSLTLRNLTKERDKG